MDYTFLQTKKKPDYLISKIISTLLLILLFSSSYGFVKNVCATDSSVKTFHVFQTIPPNPNANVGTWAGLGVPTNIADDLVNYQKNPSMTNAIKVIRHYNTFAKLDDVRRACFAHNEKLFQTLDAAKYELIMRTQQRIDGIHHVYRAGSTAARFKAWIDWKLRGGSLDDMPKLNPNKQMKSDDDIVNVASKKAIKANPLASELLNGETARDEFKKMTRDEFGVELDPKDMQVEFLSPTSAYSIMHIKRPGEYNAKAHWPGFMQAWFSADPEKYNGEWGVEQLHEWGMGAGYVTTNVNNPLASGESYADFNSKDPENAFPKFPPDDLFGWISNNHRQIFEVHGGDLKSLAKYMLRETGAWKKLKLKIPVFDIPGKGNMSVEDLEVMARMIYKPEGENEIQHVKNIAPTAGMMLTAYLKSLLVEAHKQNVQMLIDKLKAIPPPRPPKGQDVPADPTAYLKAAQDDPEIKKIMNNIAVGYTNLDEDTLKQIELELEKDVDLGSPDDLSKNVKWDDAFKSRFSAHLKTMIEDMRGAAKVTKNDIEAFRFMRYTVGEQMNTHLVNVAGKNLDDYLTQAAMGDVTEDQFRWMGGQPRSVKRVLTPEEIADDFRFMRAMGEEFNYGDKKTAIMVDDYFKGNPPAALKMLKLLHQIYDPTNMRPVAFKYKDSDGNETVKQIQPGRWESVRSLGVVMFKGALKGWKIWGDLATGRDLFQNMYKIYGDTSATAEDIAAAQAKSLSSFIGIVEYVELVNLYGASTITANIPLGGTLGQAAQLADGGYMEAQAQKDLALSLIKDITIMYIPHLAVANAVWGIGSWGYDKYTLSGSKAEFLDLLVENGEWEIEKVKVKDADGNEREVPDRTKLPELEFIKYTTDGTKVTEQINTHKLTKGGKEVTTCWKLAKLLDKKKYPNGIKLIKTKTFVNPRDALLEIAYRDGQGYIAKHQMLSITEKAIRDLIDDYWFQFTLYWTKTKDWNMDWLKKNMGVKVPTPEDSRVIVRKKVEVDNTIVDWFGFGSPVQYDWNSWVTDGIRKNFGYLVSDYWTRRQIILEDDIIPMLIEEAARRTMKDDMDDNVLSYLDEIDQMDKRMMKLDDRVWPEIERSADPFNVTKPRDPKEDIPITKRFRFVTREERAEIKKMVTWIKDTDPNRADYSFTEMTISHQGDPRQITYPLSEDGVKDKAKEILNKMTDEMFKFEEAYDKMLKKMEGMNGYVAQAKGSPLFTTGPHHIHLRPFEGRASETKLVDKWEKGYKEELVKVEQDVGNALNVRGWDKVKGFERFMADWTGTGFEFYAAKSHPYWNKLLRLRFQIHKLQLAMTNISEVTKTEIHSIFKDGRMLLEDKSIDPDNPPTSLTPEVDDSASSGTAGATPPTPPESPLGLSNPMEREAFVTKMIELMEEEYKRLLNRIFNMFDMEVEIKPHPPATELAVMTVMEASITHNKAKKGQVEQSKIKDIVKKYKWEVYRRNQTKYIEKESKTSTINLPLFEGYKVNQTSPTGQGAAFLLLVKALGEHDIPLSQATQTFSVKPARFTGTLKIWGDWPGHAPIQLLIDARFIDIVEPGAGTDIEEQFDIEVTKAPRLRNIDLDDLENKFYVDFKSAAEVGIKPKARSKSVPGETFPGEFWLYPDQPLELFYPYLVTVDTIVKDASGTKLEKDFEIIASGGPGKVVTEPPYIIPLFKDNNVNVKAKRTKEPKCEGLDGPQTFDPANGNVMTFEIMLPFFEKGNLTVKGIFMPPVLNPQVELSEGSVRPNIGDTIAVGAGGEFSFVNNVDILLAKMLNIEGIMYGKGGRMFIPKGGVFKSKLKEGPELDLGNIDLDQHKVEVDPIKIKVVDWTGAEIPEDKLTVIIDTKAVSHDGTHFSTDWTFEKKDEKVTIKAKMELYDGPVEATTTLSINDFDVMKKGKQTLPQPIEIRVPVYLSLTVSGNTKFVIPQGKTKPNKVKISNPDLDVDQWFDSETPFDITITKPVRIGGEVKLDATAKSIQGLEYKGQGLGKAPQIFGPVNIGVITLRPGKGKGFVNISGMSVTGASSSGKPISGQGMKASAVVTVGDYDGPIPIIEWSRLSDGATDLQFKTNVSPGESFNVNTDLPPHLKGKGVKDDTIVLRVSDDIENEVSKSHDFTWKRGDEFMHFVLEDADTGKLKGKFEIGDNVSVTGTWKIVDDKEAGKDRHINYLVNGSSFYKDTIEVQSGKIWKHSAILDTKSMSKGMARIRADLHNPKTDITAVGEGKLFLAEGEDEITSAKASTVKGGSRKRSFSQGGKAFISANIQAAKKPDGNRTLTLTYRGKAVLSETFDMKGGSSIQKAFAINTGKMEAGRYAFTLLLNNDNGKQDRKIVRIKIKEDLSAPSSASGGMTNVNCTGDTVSIMVWDHGAQDGDIITLTINNRKLLEGFDLNGCGGSEPGCSLMNVPLPLGSRIPITVYAHNEGSSSPNTATLKIEGGCTPEKQNWGLKTNESASIFLTRTTAQQQQQGPQTTGQPGSPAQTQSWP